MAKPLLIQIVSHLSVLCDLCGEWLKTYRTIEFPKIFKLPQGQLFYWFAYRKAIEAFPRIILALVAYPTDKVCQCTCQEAMLRYKKQGTIGEDWHQWISSI